jgi:hypothetical protein
MVLSIAEDVRIVVGAVFGLTRIGPPGWNWHFEGDPP